MRRLLIPLIGAVLATAVIPTTYSFAQDTRRDRAERAEREKRKREDEKAKRDKRDARGPAPLARVRAQGPCPYVKILYDAARYVEFTGERQVATDVAYTGEIQGVESRCSYEGDEPIRVDLAIAFALGKGPQARAAAKNYRWWVAVTERNKAVLHKQYFDLPVEFAQGSDRAAAEQMIEGLTIPRAAATVSGSNFEILVGFDVTPQMAQFNRDGRRFRVNAGQTPTS